MNLITDDELKTHECLERVDKHTDPEIMAFKRRARLKQALWREGKRFDIGTQPTRPKEGQPSRPLGSRIPFEFAKDTKANFLTKKVREAVQYRIEHPEHHQMLKEDRLYCDLLSSMPMCFNLFGSLYGDMDAADKAIHSWWEDVPGRVSAMRFEWSPGRLLQGEYLENRSAFDVAFELTLTNGTYGILGVETKYHEDCKREKIPRDDRLRRYKEVTDKSGAFEPEACNTILGTNLQQIWLDHLLALSMVQHTSHKWSWAKFVLVYPARNISYARATENYTKILKDSSTFGVSTIESLLQANQLSTENTEAFKERYLW
ncbi:MAG: hypothetical protein HN936_17270 [Bacteroidetes bacterium]|nr:hypothetical protein [Bacteroidota bacterium]